MGINGYPPLWNTLLLACRAYNNSFRSSCRTGDFERALARGHVVGVYGCLLFSSTCHVDIGSHGAFVWDYIVYYIYIHIYIYITYYPWFPSHNTCSLLSRYPKCCFLSRVQGQNLSFCFISPLHLFLLVSRVCCSWSTFVLPCLVLEISLRNRLITCLFCLELSNVLLRNIRTKPNISVFFLGKNHGFCCFFIPTFPIFHFEVFVVKSAWGLGPGPFALGTAVQPCRATAGAMRFSLGNLGETATEMWKNMKKAMENGEKKRCKSWRMIDIC